MLKQTVTVKMMHHSRERLHETGDVHRLGHDQAIGNFIHQQVREKVQAVIVDSRWTAAGNASDAANTATSERDTRRGRKPRFSTQIPGLPLPAIKDCFFGVIISQAKRPQRGEKKKWGQPFARLSNCNPFKNQRKGTSPNTRE
jgi:hypothetical protein